MRNKIEIIITTYKLRIRNHLTGILNVLTILLSIPILAGGIWLTSRSTTTTTHCLRFLQWPLIIIGTAIIVGSLAGFAAACYRNTFLTRLYLAVMFVVIALLIGSIIFAYVITDKGSGRVVKNRAYLDYYLKDYSSWLEDRVASDSNWRKIRYCIRDSKVCAMMGKSINGVPESPQMFFLRRLTPIQSGCCKPPTDCGFIYQNETVWNLGSGHIGANLDCTRWSNDQEQLCYACDSCKAGVLAGLKKSWRKVSVINIVIMIILVIVFLFTAYAAFRKNCKIDNDEPCGKARMTKEQPSKILSKQSNVWSPQNFCKHFKFPCY